MQDSLGKLFCKWFQGRGRAVLSDQGAWGVFTLSVSRTHGGGGASRSPSKPRGSLAPIPLEMATLPGDREPILLIMVVHRGAGHYWVVWSAHLL